MSVGSALGAALTNRRALGAAESGLLVKMAFAALVTAAVGVLWPAIVAWPAAAPATFKNSLLSIATPFLAR